MENESGFEFESGSVHSIVSAMKKVAQLDHDNLIKMTQKSHELGLRNSPELWVSKLLSFLT